MYNTEDATPVEENHVTIGYLLKVSEEYWLPLTADGKPCGPPSYLKDAENTVHRSHDQPLT